MKISTWIKIILVIAAAYGIYQVIAPRGEDVSLRKVSNENFQTEVLNSPIPVVVIFCSDELWSRKSSLWSLEQPAPVILALKEIIKEQRYENKVKFYRYTPTRPDPWCSKFNIKWFPTVILFKNGNIIKKFEGGGCTVEESKQKIEQYLKKNSE